MGKPQASNDSTATYQHPLVSAQADSTPDALETTHIAPSAGRHALFTVGSSVTVGVINYALNIFLGWSLPAEEYGRVGVSQTLIFVCVWLISAGFPWVVTRAIAQAVGHGPPRGPGSDAAWRTYKSAWVAGSLLTSAVVTFLVGSFYLGWLPLEPAYAPLIVIVAITVGGLGLGSVPNAALQGLFRIGRTAVLWLIEAVANIVISVALVLAGLGAGGALAGFAGSAVLESAIAIWLLRDTRFWEVRRWGGLSALRTALPMTLAVFGGVMLTNIDLLSIKFLSGAANSDALSGAYQVAAVLARTPLFVGTALVTAFYPRVARDAVSTEGGARSASGRDLVKWVLLGVLPINVIMGVGAPAVVVFFFPERYASSASILAVLAVGSAFLVVASALASILQAMHRVLVPALVMSATVALDVLGLWFLTPRFGAIGAACSSASSSAMACALLLWCSRRMHLGPLRAAGHVVALVVLGVLMAILTLFFSGAGRVVIAIWVACAASVYVASLFALKLVSAADLASSGGLPHRGLAGVVVRSLLKVGERLNHLGSQNR